MALMAIDPRALTAHVLIVSVSTIGITQFLKSFVKCKVKKTYGIISLFILLVCAVMQTPLVGYWTTTVWNLVTLGLAVVKIGYDAVIQGIPALITKAMGGNQHPGFGGFGGGFGQQQFGGGFGAGGFGMGGQGFGGSQGFGSQAAGRGISAPVVGSPPPGCPDPLQYQ